PMEGRTGARPGRAGQPGLHGRHHLVPAAPGMHRRRRLHRPRPQPVHDLEPLTGDNFPAPEDLFGRTGASNGCWCMYWRGQGVMSALVEAAVPTAAAGGAPAVEAYPVDTA